MPKCLSFLHKGCRIILIDHDLALDFLAQKIDSFCFVFVCFRVRHCFVKISMICFAWKGNVYYAFVYDMQDEYYKIDLFIN